MEQKGRRESEEYVKVLRRHIRGPSGGGDSGWRGGQMGDSRWEKWADGRQRSTLMTVERDADRWVTEDSQENR